MKSFARIRSISSIASFMLDLLNCAASISVEISDRIGYLVDCSLGHEEKAEGLQLSPVELSKYDRVLKPFFPHLSEFIERWVRNAQSPPASSQRERRPSRAG